ncbi:PQQ-binding-like beta-propeller repeat protein [Bacteroidota bacterium]
MKKNITSTIFLFVVFISTTFYSCSPDESNWTHFRGSNLDGISEVDFAPVKWTNDSNILWKTEIHDKGWSSPVIYGNQVWMTTALEKGEDMYAVCVDYETGETIFDIILFTPDSIFRKHNINSYATPTPCIEEGYVYVNFGRYGTACISTGKGSVVWQRTDLQCTDIQGPGSSLVLYKNTLIVHCEGIDVQYIVALDKATGETIWRTDRPKELYDELGPIGKKAYITPLIINVNGRDLMISNGSAVCIAYDPDTGEEVWRIPGGVDSTISMPFSDGKSVYFYTGFFTPEHDDPYADLEISYAELLAVNPDGQGDILETNVLWRMKAPILQLLTPIVKNGLIYTIDSKSIMMCIEAKTGEVIWSERVKGKFNASPVYANGNIYFSSTQGNIIVIKAGRELDIIAETKMDGEIWATPAILRNSILVRTSKYLYRIGA